MGTEHQRSVETYVLINLILMKKPNMKLLSIGLVCISIVLILIHYLQIPDFIAGCLLGVGLGLMVFSFLLTNKKIIRNKR